MDTPPVFDPEDYFDEASYVAPDRDPEDPDPQRRSRRLPRDWQYQQVDRQALVEGYPPESHEALKGWADRIVLESRALRAAWLEWFFQDRIADNGGLLSPPSHVARMQPVEARETFLREHAAQEDALRALLRAAQEAFPEALRWTIRTRLTAEGYRLADEAFCAAHGFAAETGELVDIQQLRAQAVRVSGTPIPAYFKEGYLPSRPAITTTPSR